MKQHDVETFKFSCFWWNFQIQLFFIFMSNDVNQEPISLFQYLYWIYLYSCWSALQVITLESITTELRKLIGVNVNKKNAKSF